jgi:hypothetical protein
MNNEFDKWINTDHGKEVYRQFTLLARQRQLLGLKASAMSIVTRLRWDMDISRKFYGHKIANKYIKELAKRLMKDDPSFSKFFEFKKNKKTKGRKV